MGTINGIYGASSFYFASPSSRGALDLRAAESAIQRVRAKALERIGEDLRGLGRALDDIRDLDGLKAAPSGRTAASSTSASDLGLGTFSTAARLISSSEVNTTPTSFMPFGPTVSGNSTTLPTIGGTYDGSEGDDVLTFEFRQNSVVGAGGRLRVRVFNSQGQVLENLRFDSVAANQPVTLSNGLTLSLDTGGTVKNDTFQVAVSATQGSAVDPDLPFDGVRNENPNFELGLSVTAGSFDINGVSIAVGASDTLNSVLATINASGAGVDANFDAATESVIVTQLTPGSSSTITVGNDTSGFLAATKLDTAIVSPGTEGDHALTPLAQVPLFSRVVAGSISVNGVGIAIDPATDTLQDVLARVSVPSTGVVAMLDSSGDRVTFASINPKSALELSDGGTGFLAAIEIAQGRVEPRGRSSAPRLAEPRKVADELDRIARALQDIFGGGSPGAANDDFDTVRSGIEEALRSAFDRLDGVDGNRRGAVRSGFGIDLTFEKHNGDVLSFDMRRFDRAERGDAATLNSFLFGEADSRGENAGLIPSLLAALEIAQQHVETQFGQFGSRAGRRVDLFA